MMQPPTTTKPNKHSGLTLIELMITLAIIAILLAQTLPGFGQWMAGAKQTSSINRMVMFLQLARSESIKRGQRTVLCTSSDALTCNKTGKWEHGYILFTDDNGNRQPDTNDQILQIQASESAGLVITSSVARTRLTFQPTGMSPGSNATITFCDAQARIQPKALIISNSGRPRVSDSRPDGSPIICT